MVFRTRNRLLAANQPESHAECLPRVALTGMRDKARNPCRSMRGNLFCVKKASGLA